MILSITIMNNLLQRIFIKKYKQILLQFIGKKNKADQVMKKIILKRDIIIVMFCCFYFSHFYNLISLFLNFGSLLSIWETNWKVLPLAKLAKLRLPRNL